MSMRRHLTLFILFLTLFACQKDDDSSPVAVVVAACRIQKEMTDDGHSLLYSYDDDGNPTKIESYNPYYMTHVLNVLSNGMSIAEVNKLHPMTFTTYYGVGFLTALPDVALISVTMDSVTQVNWKTYFFHYDFRGRLVRVGEETENVQGDDEWELLITYNEQDNVIKMVYRLTTGTLNVSTVIVVDGHDHHQTPYAGVKGYKFLTLNWDNSDSWPIITALSKNNPTRYRLIVNEVESMEVSIEYEYNEQGFPLVRTVTNRNDAGQRTYRLTYEYACQ
jgi:hypothetical protein